MLMAERNIIKWRDRGQTGEPNQRQPNNFPIFAFNPPPLTNTIAIPALSLSTRCLFLLHSRVRSFNTLANKKHYQNEFNKPQSMITMWKYCDAKIKMSNRKKFKFYFNYFFKRKCSKNE